MRPTTAAIAFMHGHGPWPCMNRSPAYRPRSPGQWEEPRCCAMPTHVGCSMGGHGPAVRMDAACHSMRSDSIAVLAACVFVAMCVCSASKVAVSGYCCFRCQYGSQRQLGCGPNRCFCSPDVPWSYPCNDRATIWAFSNSSVCLVQRQ